MNDAQPLFSEDQLARWQAERQAYADKWRSVVEVYGWKPRPPWWKPRRRRRYDEEKRMLNMVLAAYSPKKCPVCGETADHEPDQSCVADQGDF